MKQVEVKYSYLLGKALSFNALVAVFTKDVKKKGLLGTDCEKKERKFFGKIGSKRLYGFSLLVDRLLNN